jgi:pSer/pThr/pTyr-binding forkhead associated (FHA) protein/uncharacterized OB-fold protein
MNCPNCNSPIQPGAAFCDNCGASVTAVPAAPAGPIAAPVAGGGVVCPNCHTAAMPGEAFCGNCGASLPQAGAAPASPPPAAPGYAPVPPAYPPALSSIPAPAGGALTCASCGVSLQPGSAFCDNCGAPVSGAPPTPQQGAWTPPQSPQWSPPPQQPQWPPQQAIPTQPDQPRWQPGPTITPRLVVQATNAPLSFPMGKSELLIGREDPVSGHFPDINLGPHGGEEGGVSRSHAKLHIQGSQCFLEDMNSVNYTHVNKQRLNPGTRQPLNTGDELRFGKVVVMFYTQ